MLEHIGTYLRDQCKLDINSTKAVIVAVSGGPDSLCLLDILDSLGYPIIISHFNHGLRSTSDSDAQAVRREAEERSLPFVLGQDEVAGFADRESLSIEEAARIMRYRFLFSQAEYYDAQAVAVGHTADDQVETVLMHLLRGSGLSGLTGMPFRALPNAWSESIPIVRPLLPLWRGEILAYCRERGLEPVIDRSNLDTTIYRNRLRHELIPYLQSYNPGVKQVLYRTSQVLSGDMEVLLDVVGKAWDAAVLEAGQGYVALDTGFLLKQPIGIQRQLLRQAIDELRPDLRDIDYDSIQRGLDFLEQPSQTCQIDLVAGLRLVLEHDKLWVANWEADLPSSWPQITSDTQFRLRIPTVMNLENDWCLQAEKVAENKAVLNEALVNTDPYQVWIAAGKLNEPLIVRTRQPGDRFKPLGMDGHSIKLSEFMINVKLPKRAREKWPLVCMGKEIVWIPGYRLGHPFRITPGTEELIHLQLIHVDKSIRSEI